MLREQGDHLVVEPNDKVHVHIQEFFEPLKRLYICSTRSGPLPSEQCRDY